MVMKSFESSPVTIGLRALINRLDCEHPLYSKLVLELQQAEAGDYGEEYIVKQLQKMAWTMDIKIFHNVTIQKPFPIQLDVVVVTPVDVLIIESKIFVEVFN
ncbi:MAG: NERD domain-containing protein [Lysinibacillus sp.]